VRCGEGVPLPTGHGKGLGEGYARFREKMEFSLEMACFGAF